MLPYRNLSIPGREPFRWVGWRGQPRTLVGGEWRLGGVSLAMCLDPCAFRTTRPMWRLVSASALRR